MKSTTLSSLPSGLVFLPGLTASPQNERVGSSAGAAPAARGVQGGQTGQTGATQKAPGKPGGRPPGRACGNDPTMIIMLVGMVVFFYFFLIRPQQKQEKQRKAMLAALKKNDKVLTTSGIYGTVAALDERTVTLKIDEKGDVRVKFDRSAITAILNRPTEPKK